jgi:ribosome maturation factor RimP
MANQSQLEERIRQIAERVASSEGLEIVEVLLRGGGRQRLLRLVIDKLGGVSHADCELISRQVGTILDVEDFMSGPYRLEVSSPGLDRKLLKAADYERFAGKKARVKLRQPVGGQQQFTGRLLGSEAGAIGMAVDSGSVVRFRFEDVEQARLVVEL